MAALVALVLSACSSVSTHSGEGPRPANANEVVISNYTFIPRTLTVSAGTTVTWVNHDMARHTVTRRASDEPFDSGLMGNQQVFSHAFTAAGSYSYVCAPHSGMQGTIIVRQVAP